MREEESVIVEASRWLEAGRRFAMATIVEAHGATPRKVGARMLIEPDGKIFGTIGGAAAEVIVVEKARKALEGGDAVRIELDLNDLEGHQTGMICGGRIAILVEPFGAGPRLILFGAGHCGYEVARLVGGLGFNVVVYDERPDWASRERFPNALINVGPVEETANAVATSAEDFIAIMTHCHADDYKVLTRVLRKPAAYLGVIGSKRKAVEIRSSLKRDGFSEAEIGRVKCPIGLDIGSHTPLEIAVAVAAEMVAVKNGYLNKVNNAIASI